MFGSDVYICIICGSMVCYIFKIFLDVCKINELFIEFKDHFCFLNVILKNSSVQSRVKGLVMSFLWCNGPFIIFTTYKWVTTLHWWLMKIEEWIDTTIQCNDPIPFPFEYLCSRLHLLIPYLNGILRVKNPFNKKEKITKRSFLTIGILYL